MIPERRRLTYALLLSLLIHTWLLRLTFGGQGLWLPASGFLWPDRRIEIPVVRVVLAPVRVTAARPEVSPIEQPMQQAPIERPVASESRPTPPAFPAPTPRRPAVSIVPKANPTAEATPKIAANPTTDANPGTNANPKTDVATRAVPMRKPLRAGRRVDKALRSTPAPPVIAVAPSDEATWTAPVIPPTPASGIEASSGSGAETEAPSPREVGDAARARIDQEASERATEVAKPNVAQPEDQRQAERLEAAPRGAPRREAAQADNARLDVERQEAERQAIELQEAARREAAQREAAQKEAARIEAARIDAERAEAARVAAARAEAERTEAARIEAERAKAERAEAARVAAARAEAERIETAHIEAERAKAERAEAARVAAARAEAERAEAARVAAARAEAERAEAARVAAARADAERAEAARVAAARAEAERIKAEQADAARAEVARVEAARIESERAETERREAARRAIGRQLDEEAAQRQAAVTAKADPSRSLPPPWSLRRYKLFGRTDPNAELIRWAEAWARKIHLNMTLDMVREAAKQPHTDPIVTVAVRSDGSVESVTFVVSSGVAAIDDAIRRIVDSQAPYQVFPPEVAREWDVIEIRRTWYFDSAVRLY